MVGRSVLTVGELARQGADILGIAPGRGKDEGHLGPRGVPDPDRDCPFVCLPEAQRCQALGTASVRAFSVGRHRDGWGRR